MKAKEKEQNTVPAADGETAALSDETLDGIVGGASGLEILESALQNVLRQEASVGAERQRPDFSSNKLTASSENVQHAETTYSSADAAKEMTEYTKNNILLQTQNAMLAQANQCTQGVLNLLQ